MLNTRKQKLLKNIIKQYYKTAQPIASSLLCSSCKMHLSPATIRNEMADLEKQGYIVQPHTSAGRIPTEKGYQFFIDNFLDKKSIEIHLKNKKIKTTNREDIKNIAKQIAETTKETIVIAFSKNDIYYTGISNLFSKPEFQNFELIHNISFVLERLEDVIIGLEKEIDDSVQIFIGSNNPIEKNCSTLVTKYNELIFGIVGPMRMDYTLNYNLLRKLKTIIH